MNNPGYKHRNELRFPKVYLLPTETDEDHEDGYEDLVFFVDRKNSSYPSPASRRSLIVIVDVWCFLVSWPECPLPTSERTLIELGFKPLVRL